MAIYQRDGSPFWWVALERPGQRAIRQSTKVRVVGATPTQTKANKQMAEAVYHARMGDLARARNGLAVEKPRISFKQYRAWYLEHISAHKRNQIREASMLRQLGLTFDRSDLTAIDVDAARAWRTARSKQVAPATVNREIDLLKHVLASAVPKYLETNPVSGLGRLRVPERETRILARDEEARLLQAIRLDLGLTALVLCALDTLQRLSSVADLRRAQDHGTYITFLNTKTTGGRVPVSSRLRAALDAHLATLPPKGAYVFPAFQGGSVGSRRNLVIRHFAAACEAAEIHGFTFHGLRHTGASRMLAAKVDIETVRRIGGWANYDVLRRYLHPEEQAASAAVETIGPPQPTHTRQRLKRQPPLLQRVR